MWSKNTFHFFPGFFLLFCGFFCLHSGVRSIQLSKTENWLTAQYDAEARSHLQTTDTDRVRCQQKLFEKWKIQEIDVKFNETEEFP